MHKHGEPIDTVYFIGGGTASVTNVMTDGRMVEVATIGNEGVVGMTVFLGGTISRARRSSKCRMATVKRCQPTPSGKS